MEAKEKNMEPKTENPTPNTQRRTPNIKVTIPDDVMFRILGDEAVLLNLVTGTYFGLDDVGTRMWQILSEHRSTDKVVETMLDEYEVEESLLRSDLDKLINNLIENGLVKPDAEETSPSE